MRNAVRIIILLGVGFAMLPVLYPVWNSQWTETSSLTYIFKDGTRRPAPGEPSDKPAKAQMRAFLFIGPKPPKPVDATIGPDPATGSSFWLTTSMTGFTATPDLGRMLVECVAVVLPFLIAAGAMFYRGASKPAGGFNVIPAVAVERQTPLIEPVDAPPLGHYQPDAKSPPFARASED